MSEENIKVAVRVRPFTSRETSKKAVNVISVLTDQKVEIKDPTDSQAEPKVFEFDHCFWSHDGFEEDKNGYLIPKNVNFADQKKVFGDLGREMLDSAWKGYNCSLIAYGQTGSGKSYNMFECGSNKGIVSLTCEELFKGIDERKKTADKEDEFQVHVSMLEIYIEQVRDLFSTTDPGRSGLKIRQHHSKGFIVENLRSIPVGSYSQIEARINDGNKKRTVASTEMNVNSCRTDTMVMITFVQKYKNDAGQSMTQTSDITLVDLAGSERQTKPGATGERLKEAASIGMSLTPLSNCIMALADQSVGKKNTIVPYRDSVLTRLLKNTLGGNCKTVMLATLSPADCDYEETLSTLRFANRVKAIRTHAEINESPTDEMIRKAREEHQALLEAEEVDGEIKKKIAASEQELKPWEERLTEYQAESMELIEAERKISDGKKVTPHLWNLNEDPAFTARIVHFCPEGTCAVGNKHASPVPKILLNGLGIGKEHAAVTNKGGVVTVTALSGSRVLVNGKSIVGDVHLHHNDSITFGFKHMYVFHHPVEEAKQIKSGNKIETPTYYSALQALAKEYGIAFKELAATREEVLLQETCVQTVLVVKEANVISEELGKKVKFKLIIATNRDGFHEVQVKMKNLITKNCWHLSRSDFINRKYLMQEIHQQFVEGYADWDKPKENDPFWESHTTPVVIGGTHIFLQSIAYLLDYEDDCVITNYKGMEVGHLVFQLAPCDSNGLELDEDEFVEDPKELRQKMMEVNAREHVNHNSWLPRLPYITRNSDLHIKFVIKSASGISPNFEKTYCTYKIFDEDKLTKTEEVNTSTSAVYNHERQVTFKVTDQLLDYLESGSVLIQVWGVQKENGAPPGNAQDLKQDAKSSLDDRHVPGTVQELQVESHRPSAGGATAEELRQLQEQLERAKARGLTSIPIEDIQRTLAKFTGIPAPVPAASTSASSLKPAASMPAPAADSEPVPTPAKNGKDGATPKGTSRACVLQ